MEWIIYSSAISVMFVGSQVIFNFLPRDINIFFIGACVSLLGFLIMFLIKWKLGDGDSVKERIVDALQMTFFGFFTFFIFAALSIKWSILPPHSGIMHSLILISITFLQKYRIRPVKNILAIFLLVSIGIVYILYSL